MQMLTYILAKNDRECVILLLLMAALQLWLAKSPFVSGKVAWVVLSIGLLGSSTCPDALQNLLNQSSEVSCGVVRAK